MQKNTIILEHPLVQHKLSLMRKKDTSTQSFRRKKEKIIKRQIINPVKNVDYHSIQMFSRNF